MKDQCIWDGVHMSVMFDKVIRAIKNTFPHFCSSFQEENG